MKKIIFFPIAAILLATVVNAQANKTPEKKDTRSQKKETTVVKKANMEVLKKLEGTVMSPLAKKDFSDHYGNIPAIWKRTTNYDLFTFTSGGEKKTSYYDADAKLVGTIIQKKFDDLPDDSQKYIKEHYPRYIIEDVAFYIDNELNIMDIVVFNRQFEDEDCYYVKMKKDNKEFLMKIKQTGEVADFRQLD